MAAMTPYEALKEFLDDGNLRAVAQPIMEAFQHSTADIDQLANSIETLTQSEDDHHNFYQAYFQAVRYTGSTIPYATRLVELLNSLSKNGPPLHIAMYIEEYGLGMLARCSLHLHPGSGPWLMQDIGIAPELGNDLTPLDAEQWDDHIGTFTSAQTWAAVYYMHGTIIDVRIDLLWDAEFLFVNALETSLDTDVHIRASRLYLESAQRWMKICGRQIYNICRGQFTLSRPDWSNDSGIICHGGRWLWTGGHVLDMTRWDFWKSRFTVLADLQLLDQMARSWARDGLRHMKEADGSNAI